jgi:hypothetical protein
MICVKERIKMTDLRACIRPSTNNHPGLSGRKANQKVYEIVT